MSQGMKPSRSTGQQVRSCLAPSSLAVLCALFLAGSPVPVAHAVECAPLAYFFYKVDVRALDGSTVPDEERMRLKGRIGIEAEDPDQEYDSVDDHAYRVDFNGMYTWTVRYLP